MTKPFRKDNDLTKIVVNIGVGRARTMAQFEEKVLPAIQEELAAITGQKAAPRPTKKAVANFKTREGDIVGLQVTLRGARMREFLTKLVRIVLPRVKDFRGLERTNVDGHGNLNIGLREQYMFPEINPEKSKVSFGLQVTVVPRTRDRERAIAFYDSIGVPLKRLSQKSK
ncbi:MAG: 50S ribosomal protein L5 [Candidatus Jorgensenbacteria bacterium]|nr:50S ribosomal protein L5 [Candidatus Jorgensenbacteria bacterium]